MHLGSGRRRFEFVQAKENKTTSFMLLNTSLIGDLL